MFKTLLIKEIRENVLDLRFVTVTVLWVTLIPLGMQVNLNRYRHQVESYQQIQRDTRERGQQKDRFETEFVGLRPPNPLSILAVGLSDFLPDTIQATRTGLVQTHKEVDMDNPHAHLYGNADTLYSMVFVVSLAVLILTFKSICGERECGTLGLMIAHPLSRGVLLLSKLIGQFLVLLVPFSLSMLAGLLLLEMAPEWSLSSPQIGPAVALILAWSLLFLLVMVCLGLCLSALTRTSGEAMVLCLMVWLLIVAGIPRMSPMLVRVLYPIAAANVFEQTQRLVVRDMELEFEARRDQLLDDCWTECGAPEEDQDYHPRQTEEGQAAQALFDEKIIPIARDHAQRLQRTLRQRQQAYDRQRSRQITWAAALSRLSPICCLSYGISNLAGTGPLETDNLQQNALAFQDQVEQKVFAHQSQVMVGSLHVGPGDDQTVDYPILQYRHPSINAVFRATGPDLLLLILYGIFFFGVAWVRFNHYDVRA